MASKKAELKTIDQIAEAKPLGPLTLGELFDYIQRRGGERVQLIRTTGTGRLDASINPRDTGNILIVIEVNPNKGVVV